MIKLLKNVGQSGIFCLLSEYCNISWRLYLRFQNEQASVADLCS